MPRALSMSAATSKLRPSAGRPSRSLAANVSTPRDWQQVGVELVVKPDAAALLAQVQHDAALDLAAAQRLGELGAAVTAGRAEQVAGDAFGVNAHDRRGVHGPFFHPPRHRAKCSSLPGRSWKVMKRASPWRMRIPTLARMLGTVILVSPQTCVGTRMPGGVGRPIQAWRTAPAIPFGTYRFCALFWKKEKCAHQRG